MFAGPSTVGKSVLAATLALRNCPVLADEITPLSLFDAGPLAVNATPDCNVLLWQDALVQLGLDKATYATLRPGLLRYVVNGLGASCPSLLTTAIRAIYLLGTHNGRDIQQISLDGGKRVLAILDVSFNRYLPQPSDLRERLFLQLAMKLAEVPVSRLLRPRVGWSAAQLADHVQMDLA